MQFILHLALTALITAVEAKVKYPKQSDSWAVGQSNDITWDTTGLDSAISINLCQGGATDLSNVITVITSQTENSGSYSWMPDSSIEDLENFSIILADSSDDIVISEIFLITGLSSSKNSGSHGSSSYNSGSHDSGSYDSGSHDSGSHDHKSKSESYYTTAGSGYQNSTKTCTTAESKTKTKTGKGHSTYATTTLDSTYTTEYNSYTTSAVVATYTSLSSTDTVQATETSVASSTTTLQTTTSRYYFNSTSTSSSNVTLATSTSPAIFTGAASQLSTALYNPVGWSGFLGLLALLI